MPGFLARVFGIRADGRGGLGGAGGKNSFTVLQGQKIQCTILLGQNKSKDFYEKSKAFRKNTKTQKITKYQTETSTFN